MNLQSPSLRSRLLIINNSASNKSTVSFQSSAISIPFRYRTIFRFPQSLCIPGSSSPALLPQQSPPPHSMSAKLLPGRPGPSQLLPPLHQVPASPMRLAAPPMPPATPPLGSHGNPRASTVAALPLGSHGKLQAPIAASPPQRHPMPTSPRDSSTWSSSPPQRLTSTRS